jgi:hypothetical protein
VRNYIKQIDWCLMTWVACSSPTYSWEFSK